MNSKSVIVTFRVTPIQFRRLKQYARRQSTTVTKIIHSCLEQVVGNR